jgi:ABC-type branched-subunit amino acid transport system substrate-binding protein
VLNWIIILCGFTMVAGCPKRTRSVVTPAEVVLPSGGDFAARTRFQDVRARFEREGDRVAPDEFEAIARDYPADPIAPIALLYAGRAALRDGDYDRAASILGELQRRGDTDAELGRRAALFAGFAAGYRGDYERAVELLRDDEVAVDDGERGERRAVLAEAYAATGRTAEALREYDAWFPLATAPERSYLVARVRALVDQLDTAAAGQAYTALDRRTGPAAAVLAERLAVEAAAAGNAADAASFQDVAARARAEIGLDNAAARLSRGGDPGLVGAALPLSGRRARVGTAAMRGLALAAGTFDAVAGVGVGRGGAPLPFALALRDSESTPEGAGAALDGLVAEGVVAVIGPVTSSAVDAAGERAADAGVPVLSLDPTASSDSAYVFHMIQTPEARARALARYAVGAGARRFAILGPDIDYGRSVGRAFAEEVARLGGQVLTEARYGGDATAFTEVVDELRGKPWDAVFVPDTARRLELVAPALAAANLVSLPAGAGEPKVGRKILLLSTAEALAPRYIRGAGRYSLGAVLAPGFYPDKDDPRIGDFATRFSAAFGQPPTYLDAYAYDAALVVRAAVESGARNRAEVTAAIAASVVPGVTGEIGFGTARVRADDGLLFAVVRDEAGAYHIRALR